MKLGNLDGVKTLLEFGEEPISDRSYKSIREKTSALFRSGLLLYRYLDVSIEIYSVNSVRGSSYIPTPVKYSNAKCGLINIRNEDNECFRWCVLYHQSKQEKHSERITVLRKITDKYDYTGLEFPVSLDNIKHFEEVNKVCIYVYEVDEEACEINECKKGNTQCI